MKKFASLLTIIAFLVMACEKHEVRPTDPVSAVTQTESVTGALNTQTKGGVTLHSMSNKLVGNVIYWKYILEPVDVQYIKIQINRSRTVYVNNQGLPGLIYNNGGKYYDDFESGLRWSIIPAKANEANNTIVIEQLIYSPGELIFIDFAVSNYRTINQYPTQNRTTDYKVQNWVIGEITPTGIIDRSFKFTWYS